MGGEGRRAMDELIVVLDCGATNLRAVAVDARGEIVGAASRANASSPQPGGKPGWLIWDLDAVWGKLSEACRELCAGLPAGRIRGGGATTWGADGAPVRADGSLAYPVISWQCLRTAPLVDALAGRSAAQPRDRRADLGPWEIYRSAGYPIISFNTLLRWLWLRENAPTALEEA